MPNAPYLIITALPEERDAVEACLPGLRRLGGDETRGGRIYYETFLDLRRRRRVIVTVIGEPGRVSAATAAASAIDEWNPEVVLLVGIAGGLADQGVLLGDVLVATQILDYEHQKVREGSTEVRPQSWPADPMLRRVASDRGNRRVAQFNCGDEA